jgi:adenylate cyclase
VESPSPDALNQAALPHKLAAILYADVEGYSRLTGADEVGTHRTLSSYLDLFTATIKAHHGEVKHYAGDAVLADFSTVSDAVNCAIAVHQAIKQKNESVPDDKRVQFRIGVNLGEVIVDRGEVYGNGVNVAARLETLAEPGGICISGAARDAIGNKLPLTYDYLGEQQVKNIDTPVRAFRVNFGDYAPNVTKRTAARTAKKKSLFPLLAALGVLAAAIGIGVWQYDKKHPTASAHANDAVYAMPTGPSIAVLPFTNMSGDPKEDYFSDGLTEDIITELARDKYLYVLARNTTFQFKGKAVDIPAVGKQLGAKYVLEGSVRRSGDQVRIAAQLIAVDSGAHIWAEKYDRPMSDIFATQDEIASKIAATIAGGYGVVERAGTRAAARKPPSELQAYDYVLRSYATEWSPAGYKEAKSYLEKAIALDPNYPRARAEYAWFILLGWIIRFDDNPRPPSELKVNAIKAVTLDPADPNTHRVAAWGYFFDHQLDRFDREASTAMIMVPNDVVILSEMGFAYTVSGQWERGVRLVTKAHTLNAEAAGGWYNSALYYDFFRKKEFPRALEILRAHPSQDMVEQQLKYVAVYAELGEFDKAREHWNNCVKLDPKWSLARMKEILMLWNFPKDFSARYLQSFAKAGFVDQ